MKQIWSGIQLAFTAVGGFLGWFLGGVDGFLYALIARVLGFTEQGRQVLHIAKETTPLYNVGQRVDHPQWAIEQRCNDLYGLFAEAIEPAGMEPKRRVIIRSLK